jgi:hypothetical protein
MRTPRRSFLQVTGALAVIGTVALAGCGGASSGSAGTGSRAAGTSSTGTSGGALAADARSASTGDIPDNQVFLLFRTEPASWSMKYPEGWTQQHKGSIVTFSDKNNLVRVTVARSSIPTTASVAAELRAQQRANPSLTFASPERVSLKTGSAVKAVYTTRSAPNPVTGKRVVLIVDRYELTHAGKVAVVDLGTPKGVDNVDAYRMMINSFRWR